MAKPPGLNFYRSDTDKYQDKLIKRLRNIHGCIGLTIYDYILTEIYRVKGCYVDWDEDLLFDIEDYFKIPENTILEIVNNCCRIGLFNAAVFRAHSKLTSKSIQERYNEMCVAMKRKPVKLPEEIAIIPENSGRSGENSGRSGRNSGNFR